MGPFLLHGFDLLAELVKLSHREQDCESVRFRAIYGEGRQYPPEVHCERLKPLYGASLDVLADHVATRVVDHRIHLRYEVGFDQRMLVQVDEVPSGCGALFLIEPVLDFGVSKREVVCHIDSLILRGEV